MDVIHSFQALGLGGSMSISISLVRGIDAWLRRPIRHHDTVRPIMLVRKEFGLQPAMRPLFEAPAMAGAAAMNAFDQESADENASPGAQRVLGCGRHQ
jgi:hypothetical protein